MEQAPLLVASDGREPIVTLLATFFAACVPLDFRPARPGRSDLAILLWVVGVTLAPGLVAQTIIKPMSGIRRTFFDAVGAD